MPAEGEPRSLAELKLQRLKYLRHLQHAPKFQNLTFDQRLLLLGILVLRIFGDVAEFFGVADPLVDLAPVDGLEVVELLLQLLKALFGEHQLFIVHEFVFRSQCTACTKRT